MHVVNSEGKLPKTWEAAVSLTGNDKAAAATLLLANQVAALEHQLSEILGVLRDFRDQQLKD